MEDNDALGLLQAVYRNPQIPLNTRLRAAGMALPFERPKLGVMMQVNGNDLADKLIRAIAASDRVINSRPIQVIEARPVSEPDEVPDHGKPFAQHRWRRF